MTLKTEYVLIDKNDAPDGYEPIPKNAVVREGSNRNVNICRSCDWRPDCDGNKYSCMSYKRKDGIGIVFKKRQV